MASLIGNGRAARLIPPENVAALTAAIIESLTKPEDSTAAADRAAVREQYALANRVEEHLAVYRELGLKV